LCYAIEPALGSGIEALQGEEPDIIKGFWRLAEDCNLFVGHNVLDFDLRFIYQRSIIHQIKPSRDIPFARFRNAPIYDTMQEWSRWGREHVSLDALSRALGIPSPKETLDGSKVYPYYRAGKLAEIIEYCKRDVESARKVYRRLTFTTGLTSTDLPAELMETESLACQKDSGNRPDKQRITQNLAAVENHFHSEALSDIEAALETFTDDVIWEAPALNGLNRSFEGKLAVADNYRQLWASMRNVTFEPLQRFATADRVVDDCIAKFEVAREGYWSFPVGSKVEMRLVHIFEMRGGKIARELVFDMGRTV
jgi:ketosteroid isomerase-like protein